MSEPVSIQRIVAHKRPAAWPPQRYGGEHYRPDGVPCSYLAFTACNKCGGAAPPPPERA